MPCDSIQTNQIDFKIVNRETLVSVLKAMGFEHIAKNGEALDFYAGGQRYQISRGQLVGYGNVGILADKIKQAYSRQTVMQAAKRFGWSVEENKVTGKLNITKRGS